MAEAECSCASLTLVQNLRPNAHCSNVTDYGCYEAEERTGIMWAHHCAAWFRCGSCAPFKCGTGIVWPPHMRSSCSCAGPNAEPDRIRRWQNSTGIKADGVDRCDLLLAARARAICRGDMNDLSILLAKLALGLPFSYVHFNEGEVRAAIQTSGRVASGKQSYSTELKSLMRRAMNTTHPRLHVGLPCRAEFAREYLAALTLVPRGTHGERDRRTTATLWINGNFPVARDFVPRLLHWRTTDGPGRTGSLYLVVSEQANVTRFTERTRLQPKLVLRVPARESVRAHGSLRDAYQSFAAGDLVVLCSGVLGRLLVPDWVSRRPKTTFLELGSFFNQHFGDVQLQAYQRKVLTPGCSTQRDRRLDDTAFSGIRRCLEGMREHKARSLADITPPPVGGGFRASELAFRGPPCRCWARRLPGPRRRRRR